MDINSLHSHRRDGAIVFDEANHLYTLGDTAFDSVTTVVEALFEPFDADYWAARKATPDHTAEMIKAEWAAKGELARNLGTVLHDRIERYYLGQNVPREWMADEDFRRFSDFAWAVRLCAHRTEWRIYHEESRIAGTLDFLALRPDGQFDIWDWKRSAKVCDASGHPVTVNPFGKTGLAPVEHLPDTTFHHYALQVSIYRYILETKYDMVICDAHLGVFHPDNPRYYVVDLPYLRHEVEAIIKSRIKQQ